MTINVTEETISEDLGLIIAVAVKALKTAGWEAEKAFNVVAGDRSMTNLQNGYLALLEAGYTRREAVTKIAELLADSLTEAARLFVK